MPSSILKFFMRRHTLTLTLILCFFQPGNPAIASTILIVGDSLSSAYGMRTQQGWVALLQQRLSQQLQAHTVINASISGETTRGGVARIDSLLKQHKPHIVIIELGGNDGLRGLSLQQIEKNLRTMIEQVKAFGADILLIGMQMPPNYGAAYTNGFKNIYATLASEFNVKLVPFLLEGVGTDLSLMQADGIHPKAEAQSKILENVWPTLKSMLD